MTADDLRAIPEACDAAGNSVGWVPVPVAARDALADLLAAARALGDDWRHGWNLYPPRDRTVALIKALAALDGTP